MTLRLSALFENKVEELLVNFYRHRSGSGRRTRQRSRRAVENEPGTSGVSSPARRAAPRARPEVTPRVSARVLASRRRDDEEEPSTSNDGLRMKISLTRGSVLSTTGLQDTERGNGSAIGTSTRLQASQLDDLTSQRARTRSAARTSFRESLSSTSSIVSETPDITTQNGPSRTRYSTRSRVPPTRLQLNGADHESEDDDDDDDDDDEEEEEEEVSEESEEETSEESDSPQHGKNLRSTRSGKAPRNRNNSSTKSGNSKGKGKQVVNSKRPVRTRASSRYDDSASESDDDSPDQQLDVSSRGRVRRKAFKMVDYVN